MAATFQGKALAGIHTANGDPGGSVTLVLMNDRVTLKFSGALGDKYDAAAKDIRYIAIENAGTKTNVGAVVVFGALGLGARRPWTAITVGFPDGDSVLAVRQPVQAVRTTLRQALNDCPGLDGRLLDGPPPTTSLPSQADVADAAGAGDEILERLERLAALLDNGTIDAGEFARLKATLIDEVP